MTTRHEVEVDTALAALWEREQTAAYNIQQTRSSLHSLNGEKRNTWQRNAPWPQSDDQTEDDVRRKVEDGTWNFTGSDGVSRLVYPGTYALERLNYLDEQRRVLAEARVEAEPLEQEFEEKRWSRFFLVQNTGGHIHSSMHCKTTFPTTRWGWLPDLSGLTEEDAVKAQGPRLCSVCYPSAPVEWTVGIEKVDPNRCPGSGQDAKPGTVNRRYYSPRGQCSVCGEWFAVSRNTDAIRAHKKPKGAK